MLALVVLVAEERYVVPAARVLEVLPRVNLSPVPRSAPWHAGLLSYRGSALPVIDLSRRLADVACTSRLGNRVLVVERTRGEERERWGLLVEQVLQVRDVAQSSAHATGEVVGLDEGELLQVLQLDAVLEVGPGASPLHALPGVGAR
jgi:chemotaxis signal transduction protein